MKKRVLLADDHEMMRQGLKKMLETELNMEVIGEASDGKIAVQLARELDPDFVVIDITMPGMNGIEATRHITTDLPGIKVIALSTHANERFVIDMLNAGANGYVLKESAFHELSRAFEAAARHQIFVSPSIAGDVLKATLERHHSGAPVSGSSLTPKEKEILQLIAEGKTNREISEFLNMSIKTVESHRQHIMDKLNLHTVAELTKYAVREGITEL